MEGPCRSCSPTPASPRVPAQARHYQHQQDSGGSMEGVSDQGWHVLVTQGAHDAWQSRLYTDLTIKTQDQVIHAHKVILAAASPYFRAMLSVGLVEGQTQTLVLEDVSGVMLNVVLTFIYTGRAMLTHHNVQHILTLADYFQIHVLKKLCCYHLKKHLSVDTCLSVYEVAALHRCHDLAAEALAMASSQCTKIISQPSFTNTQKDTILTLLDQPFLNVESEEELIDGIVRWAAEDPEERHKWLPAMMEKLDICNLDQKLRTHWLTILKEKKLFTDDLVSIFKRTRDGVICEDRQILRQRQNSLGEVLLVMAGESNGRLLRSTECFAIGYTSWRCSIPDNGQPSYYRPHQLQVLPTMEHARAYCAVAVYNNSVYILGGLTSERFLASCERYNTEDNTWQGLAELPIPIHGAAAAFLDGVLYVGGGKSTHRYHHNLLAYDEHNEVWAARCPMLTGRGHHGLAALHGSLYAVGGVTNEGTGTHITPTCEKYDPGSNTWIPVAPLGQARAYLGLAVLQDRLYAVGGYDGAKWLSLVEVYNPFRDQWTSVSPMISARSSFGITVSRGRIYCLGGFSGGSILNTVEKYNPRTNTWHCVQSMQLRRFGLVAATVNVPGLP
ncbi:hypothetical protein Pmani_014986 [Petrolisthes manimaculis]|uniref:Kelch-like protein diablo n=1 Tax=Petrolisthes manimaculis TaxID=1843537 RepID=A0AAE1U853_9EUCA|nr:hypothetical protein Pmani_014986 [Petrolisthes manimaculis]